MRQIESLLPQIVRNFSSLVMLADGAGAGIEQTVNGVVFVLLLLVHHSSVLPAGHAAVLGSHAVAVLGNVGVDGEKVVVAISAPAGTVTML